MSGNGEAVSQTEYGRREQEHREELDQLWKVVRDEIPEQILESEDRIVDRINEMDTRINGRIRRNTNDINLLKDRIWLSDVFIRLSKHPIAVSAVSTLFGIVLTLLIKL